MDRGTHARTDVGTDDYTVREGKKMGYVIKITKPFPCEGLFFSCLFFFSHHHYLWL